ncbi:MAG: hypothetical protein L0312_03330, partial [Acidobacteria bacterium]|nr:hypothetical protein [Acidobacteriota bacterium]
MMNKDNKLRACWIAFWAGTLLSAGVLARAGQEPAAEPLTEEQVLSLVTSAKLGELPASRIAELIRNRGIKFSVTDVFLLELQTREADPVVIETLRQLRGQGRDFIPTSPALHAPAPENSPSASTNAVEANWPKFLDSVRAKAIAYNDELPNFICTQVTQRSARYFPGGWRSVDNFVAELTYFEKKEHYKILTVANQATTTATMENLSGTRSTGEFGTSLRSLFDPATNANFRLEGREQTNGRETIRLGYQVARETSSRTINYNNERTIITAYRGRCWIDPQSYQVVRLEDKAINIPPDFPITRS